MDIVLIQFGTQVLALGRAEFDAALKRGAELMGEKGTRPERGMLRDTSEALVSAEEASKAAGVPKAWLLDAARQKRVPCYRLGKYVRFRLSEVVESGRRPTDR
ncbi:MAG: hypothetical protein ACREVH_01555 [Gammaproteobacteria bacterium]